MNRDELLAALNAERYGNGAWFKTPAPGRQRPPEALDSSAYDDNDITTARRRRELLADVAHQTRTA